MASNLTHATVPDADDARIVPVNTALHQAAQLQQLDVKSMHEKALGILATIGHNTICINTIILYNTYNTSIQLSLPRIVGP